MPCCQLITSTNPSVLLVVISIFANYLCEYSRKSLLQKLIILLIGTEGKIY
jgi:hypothetical protein